MSTQTHHSPAIQNIRVSCYSVPTETPESDGTLRWKKTTLVLVEASGGDKKGMGYTYADVSTGKLIESLVAEVLVGMNALDTCRANAAMMHAVRNLGHPGISAMAISAVDTALWDLKAKLLDLSLVDLLGSARDQAEIYGSGGFTCYTLEHLQAQLSNWASQGIKSVKMKIGSDPAVEYGRVQCARKAIGHKVNLFVDANGAYQRKAALAFADRLGELDVRWFEEPVSSDDLAGLRFISERAPSGMVIAAGEYGYDRWYFRRMLTSEAVDVLQADATRCGGVTGFMEAANLSVAFNIPFSFHCAPALHACLACACPSFWIGEYFFDHARIEKMFFDGVSEPQEGMIRPDRQRPGLGLEFKRNEAQKYAI